MVSEPTALAHIRQGAERVVLLACVTLLPCCSPGGGAIKPSDAHTKTSASGSDRALSGSKTQWEADIFSPRDAEVPPDLHELQEHCGRPDAALARVARQVLGWPDFDADPDAREHLDFAMRAAGVSYVWPRAWARSLGLNEADLAPVRASLDTWLHSFNDGGERRCGLARSTVAESTRFSAVVVDVLADVVRPIPTRARTGQWLDLQVQLLQTASDAKVIRQGPTGEPTYLPTSFAGTEVRARFPMPSPGRWLLQVMGMMDGGPRPVADVLVFVDEPPPNQLDVSPVPGESAKGLGSDIAETLFLMLNQTRIEEGRKPLRRSPELDRLALHHSKAMVAAGHTGHDVGDGLPAARMAAAGLAASLVGENVVRAADARRAHRELWASPSHRSNILHRGFRNVGIGAFVGPDRTVWACELFAALD
jgi:hypothetical protein